MQGSWITKETEKISTTEIYKYFQKKYSLNEAFQIWDSQKVPFLFNDKVAIVFYIERGYLDFEIYDLRRFLRYGASFALVKGLENFDFKSYYEDIKKKIVDDEIGSLECTRKLYYYINLMDENLSEMILYGDFSKIRDNMKAMDKNQIDDMTRLQNKNH